MTASEIVNEGVGDQKKTKERPKELADLNDFVSDENLIVNDPVFSKEPVEQYIDKETVKCGNVSDHRDKIAKCINCAANHLLDYCLSFLERTLRERISFLAKKFCYACLQPMKQGHNVKTYDKG